MTQDQALALDSFNVVIVGNGAIGSALLENLLRRQGLNRAVILGRRQRILSTDERVSYLTIDAEEPCSITSAASRLT